VKSMKYDRAKKLEQIALEVRKDLVRMASVTGMKYLSSSLSMVDLIVYIYWEVMNLRPEEPNWQNRDRLVLSKGHACPTLYVTLAHRGFFSREELWNYNKLGSMLQGHPEMRRTPGVDAGSGSLGLGLGIANGIALGLRCAGIKSRVFCVLGDGELQEGSFWESALTSASHKLSNVYAVIDRNATQSEGPTEEIKALEPLDEKLKSFGWQVFHANGHDFASLHQAFQAMLSADGPAALIARTKAGQGVPMMEKNQPSIKTAIARDEMSQALTELEEMSQSNNEG